MAALLAASFAWAAPRAWATDPPQPPSAPVDTTPPPDVATVLGHLITGDGPVNDVSGTVQRYLLSDKFFKAGELAKVKASTADMGVVSRGIKAAVGGAPQHVSWLYYVLKASHTSDNVPSWIQADDNAKSLFVQSNGGLRACLTEALTHAPAGSSHLWLHKIEEGGLEASVSHFVADASTAAARIVREGQCGRGPAVVARIGANDQGTPNVTGAPVTGTGATATLTAVQDATFAQTYVEGAAVGNVYRNGQDGYRQLSVRQYTVVAADGSQTSAPGIVDITNPNNVLQPAMVKLPLNGPTTITVWAPQPDGSSVPRNYVLTQGANGQVILSRPNTKPGEGGVLQFSPGALAAGVAEQAARRGTISIEGKSYYVGPQGGDGRYTYWDKAALDRLIDPATGHIRAGADPTQLVPAALSQPVMQQVNGMWTHGSDKPNVMFANQAATQNPWHLEWQDQGGWHLVQGVGNQPPAPPPSTSTSTVVGPPPAVDTTTTSGAPPATTSAVAPAGGGSLSSIVSQIIAASGGTIARYNDSTGGDPNAGFNAEWKQKLALLKGSCDIVRQTAGAGGSTVQTRVKQPSYLLIFASNVLPNNNHQLCLPTSAFASVRGFDQYLVLVSTTQMVLYQKVSDMVRESSGGQKADVMGVFDIGRQNLDSVRNSAIAGDIIKSYVTTVKNAAGTGVDRAQAAGTVVARIGQLPTGGKSFLIAGTMSNKNIPLHVTMAVDANTEQSWDVWPDFSLHAGTTQIPGGAGPGSRVDTQESVASTVTGMPAVGATFTDPDAGELTPVKRAADGSVIIFKSAANDYYVMYLVATPKDGGGVNVSRTKALKLSGAAAQIAAQSGVQMAGLHEAAPVPLSAPAPLAFGDQHKGAYCVYRYNAPAPDADRDANANSAGPVLWIGMTHDQAKAACVVGHL
jgi:hypothetical protein